MSYYSASDSMFNSIYELLKRDTIENLVVLEATNGMKIFWLL